jgi:hypothetical protein
MERVRSMAMVFLELLEKNSFLQRAAKPLILH